MSTTLIRSLKVLECVANSDTPRGISELARELDIDKSAVQRVLKSLVDAGYCEKVGSTGAYRPTLRLWEFGSKVIAKNELRRLLHPVLRYGATVSGLTVYFALADFPDIVYLDRVEGSRGRPNASDPGRRVPIFQTALGRAVLAFLEERQIDEACASLARMKTGSEEDRAAELRATLSTVRERMYAVSESGFQSGVISIAAPVWNAERHPIGSIGLTSDSATLPAEEVGHIAQIASTLAYEATRVLGGSFPRMGSDAP